MLSQLAPFEMRRAHLACTFGCDTTISENIALVAAVSSATAIAGGKYFKMPGVLAVKYLRMFTSATLLAYTRTGLNAATDMTGLRFALNALDEIPPLEG